MADEKAQLLAEAYRRGLLPPEQKAAYEEARNRGLLGKAVQPKRDLLTQATGFLASVNRGLGVGDELAAGFGSLVKGVPFKNALAQQRTIEDDFTASNHTAAALGRGIGNAAGLAVPGAPGMNALTQGSRLGNIARGAVAAGVSGATVAAADRGTAGERLRAASQATYNPINLAAGAIGGALSRVRPGPPRAQVRPEVAALVREGVQLTPGQAAGGLGRALEDAATSLPIAGTAIQEARLQGLRSFNTSLGNQALREVDDALPDGVRAGREMVGEIQDNLSGRYDELIPEGGLTVDDDLRGAVAGLQDVVSTLTPESQARLANIVDNRVLSRLQDEAMDGPTYQRVQSELGNEIRRFSGVQDPDQRVIGEALSSLRDSLTAAAARQNPEFAASKQALDGAYARYKRIEGAAANPGAVEGVFTPAQYGQAVRRGDTSVDKGRFARGEALGQEFVDNARQVLPSTIPDSGTATRGMIGALVSAPGAIIGGGAGGALGAAAGMAATGGALQAGAMAYSPRAMQLFNQALSNRVTREEAQNAVRELVQGAQQNPQLRPLVEELARRLPNAAAATTGTSPRSGVEVYVEGRPDLGAGYANRNALTPLGR